MYCMALPQGVTLIVNAVDSRRLSQIADAYDDAVRNAADSDISIGSTTTRVLDFVNRDAVFDELYIYEPLLEVCRTMLGSGLRLSSFHSRTVHPNASAQKMHIDLGHDESGPRLVSFIYMIDAFTKDNGATCFGATAVAKACGPAGSLLIFDGAVLHGHGANTTALPRRSLQGAFVRDTESATVNFARRMTAKTLDRLSPTARELLTLTGDTDMASREFAAFE